MACMCGDTSCGSCGPAQGAHPEMEVVCEWIYERICCDMPDAINQDWLAEEIADKLGKYEDVFRAILSTARKEQFVPYASPMLARYR